MAQARLGQHVRPDRATSVFAVAHLTPGEEGRYGGAEAPDQRREPGLARAAHVPLCTDRRGREHPPPTAVVRSEGRHVCDPF